MKLLALELWRTFVTSSGEVRELADPESPATYRQLSKLNRAGCLVIVEPGDAPPIRKGEAAYAVSLVAETETTDREPSTGWSFQ